MTKKSSQTKNVKVEVADDQAFPEIPVEAPSASEEEGVTTVDSSEVTLEEQLQAKEAQIQELRNEVLYRHAELENFKKRTEKRYRDLLEYASESLLKDLLPVLDNLERAVSHAQEVGAEGFAPLLEGLAHVILQFNQILEKNGVSLVPAGGQKFDPGVHEAMAQVPGEQDGLVGDVYEKGYQYKARLLRPAKVTVTKVASPSSDG